MSTADEVRRDMWKGYWRLREFQLTYQREFIAPLAKLLEERLRKQYPEFNDAPPHS